MWASRGYGETETPLILESIYITIYVINFNIHCFKQPEQDILWAEKLLHDNPNVLNIKKHIKVLKKHENRGKLLMWLISVFLCYL